MADAAAPFMALEKRLKFPGFPPGVDRARTRRPTSTPGEGWTRIGCSRKTAHGCGDHGAKLLEGITLYVRRDYPFATAAVSVFLDEEARRSIEAELGIAPYGRAFAEGVVKVAKEQEQLLVMLVAFSSPHSNRHMYYLVYDATDASLYMIPFIPANLACNFTTTPVPRFTGGAGGRDHELVLMASKLYPTNLILGGLVCVCGPATRANEGSNQFHSKSTGVWQVKPRHFPELPHSFLPQGMFCFQEKLFWADFTQGLVYCDPRDGDAAGFVKFDFISLPRRYVVPDPTELPQKRRTIGCVGSSIYFVYIDNDSHGRRPGDEMVKVWTLDMDRRAWTEHRGFPCPWRALWRQVDFMDARAGARDVEPLYPVLMPGGALCLLLAYRRKRRRRVDCGYVCSFDMRSQRPLWFGPVEDYRANLTAAILPRNFFVKGYPPLTHSNRAKRKQLDRAADTQEEGAEKCKPRRLELVPLPYP